MHHHDIPLEEADAEVSQALDRERERQTAQIELIASENIVSRAVREALGDEINNKTLEGYPGRRFHGGGEYVDVIEQLAIERAQALFGADYVKRVFGLCSSSAQEKQTSDTRTAAPSITQGSSDQASNIGRSAVAACKARRFAPPRIESPVPSSRYRSPDASMHGWRRRRSCNRNCRRPAQERTVASPSATLSCAS